ncbi:MAG: SpoIIE family protein phosphatase [Candidatus Eremiobacteraeota bacterium]|nr:SpoIIE family protein phosphatase [Candidatus Eremiobacteraeota bacterium]
MRKNRGLAFRMSLSILASCTLIFAGIMVYYYLSSMHHLRKEMERQAMLLTTQSLYHMDSILEPMEEVPENVAHILEKRAFPQDKLIWIIETIMENNRSFFAFSVTYAPYAYDRETRLMDLYYFRKNGELTLRTTEEKPFNYLYEDWFIIPQMLHRPCWSEPYYDENGGEIVMATYSVPFYRHVEGKEVFAGVVSVDISLEWLQNMVEQIMSTFKMEEKRGSLDRFWDSILLPAQRQSDTLNPIDYSFLISKNGTFLTVPRKELIMNETIFSLARSKNDGELRKIGKMMVAGETGFLKYMNPDRDKENIFSFGPLTRSRWSLGIVWNTAVMEHDMKQLTASMTVLGIIGFLILLTMIVKISRSITRPLSLLSKVSGEIAKGNLDVVLPVIREHDEVGDLAVSFSTMRDSLKSYIKELTETTTARERMRSELVIAHAIQMGLVPTKFPPFPDRSELDIDAVLLPARDIGGDLYNYFFIDENHLCLVIGDVAGKGIPAALLMAKMQTLIKTAAGGCLKPEEIVAAANREFSVNNEECMFVTLFCAIFDTAGGELAYSNAGHNPPILVKNDGTVTFLPDAGNTAVGLNEDEVFQEQRISLSAGECLVMYTDGVTEAFSVDDKEFSTTRLAEVVGKVEKATATQVKEAVLGEIRAFTQGAEQSDDITIMVLRYLGEKAAKTKESL